MEKKVILGMLAALVIGFLAVSIAKAATEGSAYYTMSVNSNGNISYSTGIAVQSLDVSGNANVGGKLTAEDICTTAGKCLSAISSTSSTASTPENLEVNSVDANTVTAKTMCLNGSCITSWPTNSSATSITCSSCDSRFVLKSGDTMSGPLELNVPQSSSSSYTPILKIAEPLADKVSSATIYKNWPGDILVGFSLKNTSEEVYPLFIGPDSIQLSPSSYIELGSSGGSTQILMNGDAYAERTLSVGIAGPYNTGYTLDVNGSTLISGDTYLEGNTIHVGKYTKIIAEPRNEYGDRDIWFQSTIWLANVTPESFHGGTLVLSAQPPYDFDFPGSTTNTKTKRWALTYDVTNDNLRLIASKGTGSWNTNWYDAMYWSMNKELNINANVDVNGTISVGGEKACVFVKTATCPAGYTNEGYITTSKYVRIYVCC